MNWFMSWFGGGDPPKVAQTPDSSSILEGTATASTRLAMREKQLKAKADKMEQEARALNTAGKRPQAMALMRQRQTVLRTLTQIQGQKANLEQTALAVESTAIAADVLGYMKDSSAVLTAQMQQLKVDEATDVTDELAEVMREAADAVDAISRPLLGGADPEMDEDIEGQMREWDDEIATMQAEELAGRLPSVHVVNSNNNNNNNGNLKVKNNKHVDPVDH